MHTKHILSALLIFPFSLWATGSGSDWAANSALQFQQQSDTRVTVGNNVISFFTGTFERMTLDANGNVGIGTVTPVSNSKLDVIGGIAVGGQRVLDSDATNIMIGDLAIGDGSRGLMLRAGDQDRLYINTDGKVGIGSDNPQYAKVQIRGGATHELLAVNRPNSDVPALYLGNDGSNRAAIASNNADLTFGRNYGNTYTEYMRLQNDSGNLGIGTTTPNVTLDVLSVATTNDKLQRWQVSDALNDYLEVSNATSANGQFMPTLKGYHTTDNRSALYITGEVDATNDTGTNAIMTFDSRLSTGAPSNRILFAWDSYGQRKMTLSANGNLHVNGTVTWPDYVFEDTYELNELEQVEKYIEKNHHLPEIPSAAEVKENGVDIVSMQAKLLQKIEELTLYVIEQNKQLEKQNKRIDLQQQEIINLKRSSIKTK